MSSSASPRPASLDHRFNTEFAKLFQRNKDADEGAASSFALMDTSAMMPPDGGLEAIIIPDQMRRPALLVRNNTFEAPQSATWKSVLNPSRSKLEAAIRSVGRVELTGHPTLPYAGTAWMISDSVAVTNRHVASIFARQQGASFVFRDAPMGGKYTARVDFREEFNIPVSQEIAVEKVLFISPDGDGFPDVALLKLRAARLPNPIELFDGKITQGQLVAAIGYPANDPRNPAAAIADVFGSVFEVKRLSPGEVSGNPRGFIVNHDCSTLGGNSGSIVVDILTGKAVGLHFGGRFRQNNMAVEASELKKILAKLKVQISLRPIPTEKVKAKKAPATLAGRAGYAEDFLGSQAALKVPLPALDESMQAALAPVKGAADGILRYTHFSIAMNATRRFAFFTACNIDGATSTNIRRTEDNWQLDPRIDSAHQIGNELYSNNDLDRGHLVRRLDPVWGATRAEAQTANDDTFYYTNSTPQHARLNQGNWNDLEDYVLSNTSSNDLRVTVFTGPVFGDDDPEYRGVFLPQAYWKVVTVVNGETRKLHTTAYMLSQRDLLTDLEFVFGQFRTYQVPVSEVEKRTGLNFGKLRRADPLKDQESFAVREITKLGEIVL